MQGLLAHSETRSPQSPIPRGVMGSHFANGGARNHHTHSHSFGNGVGMSGVPMGGGASLVGTSLIRRKKTAVVAFVVGICALLLIYNSTGGGPPKTATETGGSASAATQGAAATRGQTLIDDVSALTAVGGGGAVDLRQIPAWGYNRDRNVPRWKAIAASIAADQRRGPFTVVDYGADQGFFSISTAATFPTARVMGLEMGGVGGEIWKKKDSQDVLDIQEKKIKELAVNGRMMICQTLVKPEHFFALESAASVSDYQYVLSVFHWFNLPTRADFEKAVSALLHNAKTTFIELPTIGDNSKLIRQQVGWENFVKWYDGRTDTGLILKEAAEAHGMRVKVVAIATVPWVKWTRVVHRIDIIGGDEAPGGEKGAAAFQCMTRRKIYGCNEKRTQHQSCIGYN